MYLLIHEASYPHHMRHKIRRMRHFIFWLIVVESSRLSSTYKCPTIPIKNQHLIKITSIICLNSFSSVFYKSETSRKILEKSWSGKAPVLHCSSQNSCSGLTMLCNLPPCQLIKLQRSEPEKKSKVTWRWTILTDICVYHVSQLTGLEQYRYAVCSRK